MAAIPPGLSSPARFISTPRVRTSRSPSEKDNAPEAVRADNSPRECPATVAGLKSGLRIANDRHAAMEWMYNAGCVLIVSLSSSAGPFHINCERAKPRIASASSNVSQAIGYVSASSLPMPTVCEPCPGNIKAVVCGTKFIKSSSPRDILFKTQTSRVRHDPLAVEGNRPGLTQPFSSLSSLQQLRGLRKIHNSHRQCGEGASNHSWNRQPGYEAAKHHALGAYRGGSLNACALDVGALTFSLIVTGGRKSVSPLRFF